MKVVVGLGNPGKRYAETRHNVGWMVVDRLADRAGWGGKVRAKDAAAVAWGRYRGLDLMLVKPTTFMNESGVAVRKVLARERVPLKELLVVVDDFALPFGRLRIREGGSAGSHNGLRSIIGELGSQKFARLRVGIGEPSRNATSHVLDGFSAEERVRLDAVLDAAADAVEDWAREGPSKAANVWNTWQLPDAAQPNGAEGSEPQTSPPVVAREVPQDGIRRTRTGWRKIIDLVDRHGASER